MDVQKLMPFVMTLLLVGMIVGVGVLTLDKFSTAVKYSGGVANETVAMTAGKGTTANDELIAMTSGAILPNGTAVTLTINDAVQGKIALATPASYTGNVYTGYTYKTDSPTTTALNSAKTSVGDIAEDWMSLVVTIAVLALILAMTVVGFSRFSQPRS